MHSGSGQIYGITRIADITQLDILGIPVFAAYRPNARSFCVSGGKGLSAEQARISAYMESLESYYAESRAYKVDYVSEKDLAAKNVNHVPLKKIPRMIYQPEKSFQPINWCKAEEIISGEITYIPEDLIHLDMISDSKIGIAVTANGLSAGTTKDQAILHGICELIERDSFSIWSMSSCTFKSQKFIPHSSISSIQVRNLFERVETVGLNLLLFDMTSELGIPAINALIISDQAIRGDLVSKLDVCTGQGAHPCVEIAMIRAITEAAQSRAGLISANRDDFFYSTYNMNIQEYWLNILEGINKDQYTGCCEQNSKSKHFKYNDENLLSKLIDKLVQYCEFELSIFAMCLGETSEHCVYRVLIPGLEGYCCEPNYVPGWRAIKCGLNL